MMPGSASTITRTGSVTRPQKSRSVRHLPLPRAAAVLAATEQCNRALRTYRTQLEHRDDANSVIDVVDFFSGCGGFSAGFRLFSQFLPLYRVAGALDLNAEANETYRLNLGVEPFHGDAHEIAANPTLWRAFASRLDRRPRNRTVVVGGPPCQGFTSHKQTIKGCERQNQLFPDFARLAVRLDPDAVVMENVPELLTNRSWPFFEEAVEVLRSHGYVVRTQVHNLAEFGVPQERFRVLTVAMRHPFAMPVPPLTRNEFGTVRQAIGFLPDATPGTPHADDPDHWVTGHRASTIATIAAVPKDGGRRPFDVGPECLRNLAARNGRTGYDDVYGRLYWDRPSVTITGSSRNPASGRFSHPEANRGLSVREAAQLQGFPLNFRFSGSFDGRFLQIGNAVPPVFAAYLAGHIALELSSPRGMCPDTQPDIVRPVGASFSRLIPGIKQGAISL